MALPDDGEKEISLSRESVRKSEMIPETVGRLRRQEIRKLSECETNSQGPRFSLAMY